MNNNADFNQRIEKSIEFQQRMENKALTIVLLALFAFSLIAAVVCSIFILHK